MGQQKSKINIVSPNMDGQSNAPERRESVLDGQDNDKKEGGRSVGGLLKGFAEQTSMHGVARVAATDHHVVWRVLWLTLVLSAGGWAVYNVYQILTLFSTYPVATAVSVQYQRKVDFPAVTLCNLNTLRRSQYLENAKFLGLRSDLSNGEENTIGGALDFVEEQFQLNKIKDFLRKLPPEELDLASHQMSDMLLMCDFAGTTCHSEEFPGFFNQKFGNCFTFNKGNNRSVTAPGPSQGLKLLLTVEEEEYMPQVQSVGIKMVVHSQDALPFPENDGILLSPGSLTQVGINKNVYQRTGPPYGDCVSHSTDHNLAVNMYAPFFAVDYSAEACFNTCYQVMVASQCGCCDPDYPCSLDGVQGDRFHPSYNHTISPGILYCDFKDGAKAECVEFVKVIEVTEDGVDANPLDKCVRVCKQQCVEEVFQHQVSVAAWPTLPATQGLVTLMETHFRSQNKNTTVNAEFLNRNIIRVEVFMSQLTVEKIVTEPAYDWLHLLSDVGGQVSLWLGFSLMTAVELCQLLVDLLGLLLAKLYTYLHTHQGPRTSVHTQRP